VWARSGLVLLVVLLAVALAGVPVAHAQAAVTTSTGTLAACGVVAGAVATWNQALDAAQTTAAGRARIAPVAALNNTPGWANPTGPEPAPCDYASQQLSQYANLNGTFAFPFAFRAELEARAGGNPSWNLGVDYARQLERSVDRDEVEALYGQAGLSLAEDLRALNRAPRIAPDLDAVGYAIRNIVFNGRLGGVPVLSMHTTGDPLVVARQERAYAQAVRAAVTPACSARPLSTAPATAASPRPSGSAPSRPCCSGWTPAAGATRPPRSSSTPPPRRSGPPCRCRPRRPFWPTPRARTCGRSAWPRS
jgi:hypothetical protein